MSAFILDASVTAAWLLPEHASRHTERVCTPASAAMRSIRKPPTSGSGNAAI